MILMELEELRKEIDRIDDKIMELLGKRKTLVKEIAVLKKTKNAPVFDKERETQIIARLKKKAKENGLDEDFISKLYDYILKNSKDEQKNDTIKKN